MLSWPTNSYGSSCNHISIISELPVHISDHRVGNLINVSNTDCAQYAHVCAAWAPLDKLCTLFLLSLPLPSVCLLSPSFSCPWQGTWSTGRGESSNPPPSLALCVCVPWSRDLVDCPAWGGLGQICADFSHFNWKRPRGKLNRAECLINKLTINRR